MNKIAKIIFLWLPPLIYLCIIFYLSSISNIKLNPYTPDYVLHGVEYFILSVLALRAFNRGLKQRVSRSSILWTIAFSIAYAASDEFHQFFVPGRSASVHDLLSDAVGVVIGICFIALVQRHSSLPSGTTERIAGSK